VLGKTAAFAVAIGASRRTPVFHKGIATLFGANNSFLSASGQTVPSTQASLQFTHEGARSNLRNLLCKTIAAAPFAPMRRVGRPAAGHPGPGTGRSTWRRKTSDLLRNRAFRLASLQSLAGLAMPRGIAVVCAWP
jgi:hypothetical protein